MEIYPFLPDPAGLRCGEARIAEGAVTLELTPTSPRAECPACGQPSCRVHSRYQRLLADLPWMGTPVRLRMQVRRFFCDTPGCPRQVFAERLPQVAVAHGRKTRRLTQTLCEIGFALGGQAGSRLAGYLRMPASGDTLLRLLSRGASKPASNGRLKTSQ